MRGDKMNSKRPPSNDEEKTALVGSGLDKRPVTGDVGKTTSVDARNASHEGKTTLVDDDSNFYPNAAIEDAQGRLRPDPAPRLRWPARDLNRLEPHVQQPEGSAKASAKAASPQEGDDKTRLYNPAVATRPPEDVRTPSRASQLSDSEASNDRSLDPVVGWLVVVEGCGKGRSLEIGIGANSIGRNKDQKLRVDFGDQHISRDKHAVLIFDPRSRKFFLQSGDVRNLTYVGEELVLSPMELKGGESVLIGETKFRFVAFCGPQFGWS
jgi:FHA domain